MQDILWPKREFLALHAAWNGTGDKDQYRMAIKYLVEVLGMVNGQAIVFGAPDQSAFNEGRRWFARQIQNALTLPMERIVIEESKNAVDGSGANTFADRARESIEPITERSRAAVRTGFGTERSG